MAGSKVEEYSMLVTGEGNDELSGGHRRASSIVHKLEIEDPRGQNDARENQSDRSSRSWKYAAIIIVGEIVGSGILGLPFAMKHLGWFFGSLASPLFGTCAMYSGLLLSRARNQYFPRCASYTDLAQALVGRNFALATQIAIVSNWILLLPYFLVASSDAMMILLDEILPGANLCFYQVSLVIALLLFMPLQRRSLHGLTGMTFASDVSILVAILLMLIDFAVNGDSNASTTALPPRLSFFEGYMGISSFVFAFQGQSMFLEIMHEMRIPKHFTKASSIANTFMIVLYLVTSAWTYYFLGDAVEGFMPDSVRTPAVRAIVGLLLSYHIMCSYMLTHQPLAMQLYRIANGNDTEKEIPMPTRREWGTIVFLLLLFSYLVANIIPFFVSLQAIIGSAMGAPIMFGWPPLFYFLCCRSKGTTMSDIDKAACGFFFFVMLPFCTIVGTAAAIDDMIKQWSKNSSPFGCG